MTDNTELKLRKLHRGYVLTDFNGDEIGIKDSEQAIDELKKILKPEEKVDQSMPIIEIDKIEKERVADLQKKIFEKAKEQIGMTGKVNGAKIARELNIGHSTAHTYIKKMSIEIEALIKMWQDKQQPSTEKDNIKDEKENEIPNEDYTDKNIDEDAV